MKIVAAILMLCAVSAFGATRKQFFTQNQGITDWALRVVANGGAMPSGNTINAMEALRVGCISAGLTQKIHSLCVFVPDSVIAATTPLFLHKGFGLWGNTNFGSTNLNINGLVGDGSTKFLNTGIDAETVVVPANGSTIGLTVIISETDTNRDEMVAGQQDASDAEALVLRVSAAGITEWYATTTLTEARVVTNDFIRCGYVSGNRHTNGGTTNVVVYVASPLETHKILVQTTGSIAAGGVDENNNAISFFANSIGTTNRSWSALRMSLAMVNDGFTQTESSNFWVLARTCREALGGGTGDQVHDWNQYIVNGGGSAISSTTSNAARGYRIGMDARGLLYKVISANLYPPDNLVACRTPFLWQAGPRYYTNFNFGSSNLTINGLTGNTSTKSLGMGLRILDLSYGGFSDTSAGITVLTHTSPTTASSRHEYGTLGTGANSIFALENFGGSMSFYSWTFINVNTDFVRAPTPAPGTNWVGFMSGNRTAANAIHLDYATNTTFTVATNATGSTASNNNTLTNTFSHAVYASTLLGPTSWSDRTVSYDALHAGFTVTESSNHWEVAREYRIAIGGGYP